ncbi:MAG TPA: nucleoside-diphosphate sugar epimerase/dehydratase [Nocardioides sp.]|uniref:polysaccharide biosynthesis protein n=1 Tax=Nocardioides sp. TaxID=35761 RepID=UPI002F3E57C3
MSVTLISPARPPTPVPGLRTVVIGAGEAGRALSRDLQRVTSFGLAPICFLDDDTDKLGTTVSGLPVVGSLADLEDVIDATEAEVVVVAIPSLPVRRVRELGRRCAGLGVSVRHLPPFLTALQRDVAGTDMRTLQIGPLIGRPEIHVTSSGVCDVITGKRVLVTGAGGSIGSELCRQVAAFGPETLTMLDHDESNLHRLQLDVWGQGLLDSDAVVVADIRDRDRLHQVFRQHRPEVVFHAAALKHLPILERHPCEGVKSNVSGTENLVEAAIAHEVERFVLISTDKAANPTSVLGATKRLAEMVLGAHAGSQTMMCSVRFGNVLGSRGSLLHVVREQLASGSPVTVTHPDVTRYFMTIEEAVGLVLEAARMADGDSTYVLDMGNPVRIVDLVESFARLLNVREVEFEFTGLRAGEKLNEELFGAGESPEPSAHPRINRTRPVRPGAGFRARLHELYDAARHNRPDEVIEHLRQLVPEYAPATGLPVPAVAAGAVYPDDF